MTKKEFLTRWLMAYGSGPVYRNQVYKKDSEYIVMVGGSKPISEYRIPAAVSDGFLDHVRVRIGGTDDGDSWTITQKALDYIKGDE